MPSLGPPELIIIFLIVLVLFGASRLGDLGKGLGQGIREFRKATSDVEPPAPAEAANTKPATSGTGVCAKCGTAGLPEQRFCSQCGADLSDSQEAPGPQSGRTD